MGDIYISPNCEYCRDLLLGIHRYDFLSDKFNVINIENERYPEYIQTVPSLVTNGQLLSGQSIFKHFSDIVDAYIAQNGQNEQNSQRNDGVMGIEEPKKQEELIDKESNFEAWCPSGGCLEYSMIREDNDNFTDGVHGFNSNITYIDENTSETPQQSESRVPLSTDDTYKKNDKLKQFDSDYEQMMSIRNSMK
jgi:hypothetical protein